MDPSYPLAPYIHFVSRVKQCVEDAENIDIYQYLAFKWNLWRNYADSGPMYGYIET